MNRFFGKIGYGKTLESPANSGVWALNITERDYYGDVTRKSASISDGETLNDNVTVGNSISVVADQYANQNFSEIRYVEWEGVRWTVTNVLVQSPRLVLTLGSVYNGPGPGETL